MEWGWPGVRTAPAGGRCFCEGSTCRSTWTANGMLEALNLLVSREELEKLLQTE